VKKIEQVTENKHKKFSQNFWLGVILRFRVNMIVVGSYYLSLFIF